MSENTGIGQQGSVDQRADRFEDRLTCSVREACQKVGIGKTTMFSLISGGAVQTIKVGRRRLIKVPSLLRLVQQDQAHRN